MRIESIIIKALIIILMGVYLGFLTYVFMKNKTDIIGYPGCLRKFCGQCLVTDPHIIPSLRIILIPPILCGIIVALIVLYIIEMFLYGIGFSIKITISHVSQLLTFSRPIFGYYVTRCENISLFRYILLLFMSVAYSMGAIIVIAIYAFIAFIPFGCIGSVMMAIDENVYDDELGRSP